jgi:hypothetical protein
MKYYSIIKNTHIFIIIFIFFFISGCTTNSELNTIAEKNLINAYEVLNNDLNYYVEILSVEYVISEFERDSIEYGYVKGNAVYYFISFREEGFPRKYFVAIFMELNPNNRIVDSEINYYSDESSFDADYKTLISAVNNIKLNLELISFEFEYGEFKESTNKKTYESLK